MAYMFHIRPPRQSSTPSVYALGFMRPALTVMWKKSGRVIFVSISIDIVGSHYPPPLFSLFPIFLSPYVFFPAGVWCVPEQCGTSLHRVSP